MGSPKPMFDKSGFPYRVSESCKVVPLNDGRLAAIGYVYLRKDPELPLGNPETGVFWKTLCSGRYLMIREKPGAL